jgi:Ni,Fe-hydrogenase III large subunit/Ni,Fe-hydrogenase III component G
MTTPNLWRDLMRRSPADQPLPGELMRVLPDEAHFVPTDWKSLKELCEQAENDHGWLVNLFACDERELEAGAFKVYVVLAGPPKRLVTLEHRLLEQDGKHCWPSIAKIFLAAVPLEREMADLFNIWVIEDPDAAEPKKAAHCEFSSPSRPVLIGPYAKTDYPLRRDWPPIRTEPEVDGGSDKIEPPAAGAGIPQKDLHEGLLILPVGPIHAGVIQPGAFGFLVAGEVVEKLDVQLGFTHRGIEKLFEKRPLEDGWRLAEVVAGDSAFAHSLAWCLAVESLAGFCFEPNHRISLWRVLLLELERIANHMADCAAIVHDMAFDAPASQLSMVQEMVVRLGEELTGNRLLRGVNRPGGMEFSKFKRVAELIGDPHADDSQLVTKLSDRVAEFLDLALPVMYLPECRDRLISTGFLRKEEAWTIGVVGLSARASGLSFRDARRNLPFGAYRQPDVRRLIPETGWSKCRIRVRRQDRSGDVFARTWLRLAEIETSMKIVREMARQLRQDGEAARLMEANGPAEHPDFRDRLRAAPNFDYGIGCVEGWRGEICYWVMKGLRGSVYRCKVRDPSVFNWPALAAAVKRKERKKGDPFPGRFHENLLADFPLINKSFNLSYAGTDL